jgi:FAD binding domain in molybdopterin dehydrogenase
MSTVGGNVANGDPGDDMPALLLTLAASYELRGPKGVRKVKARDYYLGVYETAAEPDEILTGIRVPTPPKAHGFAYAKLKRKVGDYATAAVILTVVDGRVATCAVGLTMSPTSRCWRPRPPKRRPARRSTRRPLENPQPQPSRSLRQPRTDAGLAQYRAKMAGVMTARALAGAFARAMALRGPEMPQDQCRNDCKWQGGIGRSRTSHAADPFAARDPEPLRRAYRLRHDPLRRMHDRRRRQIGQVLHDVRRPGAGRRGSDDRGHGGAGRQAARASGRVPRDAWAAMRLLRAGYDHARAPTALGEPKPDRERNPYRHFRQSLPPHGYQNIVKAIQYAAAKLNGIEFREAAE